MLPLSFPKISYVDGSTVLFLHQVKHHPLVRVQNVLCADHKKLINGKKQVLMVNFKHTSV